MARLFLSLYLFIALSLVGLGAALDKLFFNDEQTASPWLNNYAFSLAQLSASQDISVEDAEQRLRALAKQSNLTAEFASLDDLYLADDIQQDLQAAGYLELVDSDSKQQLLVLLNNQQVLILSSQVSAPEAGSLLLYSALFFLLFGILLSFWAWPLWRDLSALQNASHSLKTDGSLSELTLNKRSLIYPIAASFNALARQIKRLLLTQRELTGAVAHEFRTPLARLKFALAVPPAQDSTEWLAMSQDLDELERLVQEMLDYAAMESTEPEMNVAEVPIRSLCQAQVDKLAKSHLKKLSVTVTGSEHMLWVDGHLVERAITNILLNASRYAKQQIVIQVSKQQDWVTVAIHDDGHGIAEAERAQIFEPFYRPDGDRDRKRGGAGLGLAIVKRVQLWHQGSCSIETSHLGGACFVLAYPIEELINQS